MTSAALLLLIFAATVATIHCCAYPSCGFRKPHTMCLYPTSGAATSCGTVIESGVPADDQAEILRAHNTIRMAVKDGQYAEQNLPPASVMPELAWDEELAIVAQRWADQCLTKYDRCRDVQGSYVGQNAAFSWFVMGHPSNTKNWTKDVINPWFFSELPNFRQENLVFNYGFDKVSGKMTGHLTQLIWATTTKVGCGYIATEQGGFVKRSFFCNYGPGGNIHLEKIYQV